MSQKNELLGNAAVLNFVQRCDESCELILTPEIPLPVSATYDMCNPGAAVVISIFTGLLLLLALGQTIASPIKRDVGQIQSYTISTYIPFETK